MLRVGKINPYYQNVKNTQRKLLPHFALQSFVLLQNKKMFFALARKKIVGFTLFLPK